MARPNTSTTAKPIEQYTYSDKDRMNNPPIGLVTPETYKDGDKQKYEYDPHLDPQLQWAGKAEHTSFEIPIVSLHVHERIDPRSIIEAVRRKPEEEANFQPSLFQTDQASLPFFKEVEFYKHRHNWSNRLIAGDSLLVMNSLLVKEGMAGSVQMVYFDPPYGIKYGSNFQPFTNRRDVKDGKDDDLTSEPETLKAFRDTWELGIHSYLTYLRDRLLLAREMLAESGSIFVQISDENVHLVRNLLDEVFGMDNFVSQIALKKTGGQSSVLLPRVYDILIWYAKSANNLKYRPLFKDKVAGEDSGSAYTRVLESDGNWRSATSDEISVGKTKDGRWLFAPTPLTSDKHGETGNFPFEFRGKAYTPPIQLMWKTSFEGLNKLIQSNRIVQSENSLRFVRYINDFPATTLTNIWDDLGAGDGWSKLAKNLKSEINEELIEAYSGSISLPFVPGKYKKVAVKIVDDRGIESLKFIDVM